MAKLKKKKLNRYIKICKELIDMPYNLLNLDNYRDVIREKYLILPYHYDSNAKSPTKLMSGGHKNAGIVYDKLPTTKKPNIYIIGKGVLFDAGGYDLKNHMVDMKSDMAGMAVALGVASYLNDERVSAYCPVTTNFLHNNKIIPGDYIKIENKTVEITNTDAEGRLIIAEALSNLKVRPHDIVITVATLTGNVGYALGDKVTGILTPNDKLANLYLETSKEVEELAWRLPLWNYLQKKFDKQKIQNCHEKIKPGAIMGAMFIKQFVKHPENWIHLDIGVSAYDEDKKKATGEPLKTLILFVEKLLQDEK